VERVGAFAAGYDWERGKRGQGYFRRRAKPGEELQYSPEGEEHD
jgi:hypothetical protein